MRPSCSGTMCATTRRRSGRGSSMETIASRTLSSPVSRRSTSERSMLRPRTFTIASRRPMKTRPTVVVEPPVVTGDQDPATCAVRIGPEHRVGEHRVAPVAPAQPRAPHHDLADPPIVGVVDPDVDPGEGDTDGEDALGHVVVGAVVEHRGGADLGGAVLTDDADPGVPPCPSRQDVTAEHLVAHRRHDPELGQVLPRGEAVEQLTQQHGEHHQEGDPLVGEPLRQPPRPALGRVADAEGRPEEGRRQHEGRRTEAGAG